MGTPGCLELVTLVAGPDIDGPLMTDLAAEHAARICACKAKVGFHSGSPSLPFQVCIASRTWSSDKKASNLRDVGEAPKKLSTTPASVVAS
eukprot:1503993-Amphidinium_carterae.1